MRKSEQTDQLTASLAKAQGEMKAAELDMVNPFYNSKYSSLQAVINAAKKPLADNGLAVSQVLDEGKKNLKLYTYLLHESGQFLCSRAKINIPENAKNKTQALGSELTYIRRYSYAGIIGMSSDVDDDANATQQKPQNQAANGNGKKKGHTSGDYKNWINTLLPEGKKYANVAHLRNAIRKHCKMAEFNWPEKYDEESWQEAVKLGKELVEIVTADQTPEQETLIEAEPETPNHYLED